MNNSIHRKTNSNNTSLWYWGVLSYMALPFVVLYYGIRMLFAQKYRKGLRQRLTLYTKNEQKILSEGPYIWVHTVSLGELLAARPLLRALKDSYPQYKILVSTVTETGQERVKTMDEADTSIYLPLDLYSLCRRSLYIVKPECLIIFETELWPNFIRAAVNQQIPSYLVNARLSDKSFGNYLKAKKLFAPLLNQFNAILAQSQVDAERFNQLGTHESLVSNTGNIKFDSAPIPDHGETRQKWRNLFQITEHQLFFVAGSTFAGEEALLARVFRDAKQNYANIRMLIAPRHTHRMETIEQELKQFGIQYLKRSDVNESTEIDPNAIIFLDTIGELSEVYAAADLVFIGKSLLEKGGQNPIEPAAWGKPLLFGPQMQNFRDVSALLLKAEGAITVHNEEELLKTCEALFHSENQRRLMGQKAQMVVEKNRGALQRILQQISTSLSK